MMADPSPTREVRHRAIREQCSTLEMEISFPGIGRVGMVENIVVTKDGGSFVCPRQQELTVI